MITSDLNPPVQIAWNFQAALENVKKERFAHIVRVVAFIFTNIITAAAIILTESEVVVWPIALPVITVMVVAWFIFFQMKNWTESFSKELDEKRAELAKQEFLRLLKTKLSEFDSDEQLNKSFEDLNRVMGIPVFDSFFIQKLLDLKARTSPDENLLEAACEHQINLSITYDQKKQFRGWFGESGLEYHVEVIWNGKSEEGLSFRFSRRLIDLNG